MERSRRVARDHLGEARGALRLAMASYPEAETLDEITTELIRAIASVDRARKALEEDEGEA